MPASSTLTEQLATLGLHQLAWPEEPEDNEPDNWIKRGQAYAEGIRLWRAQLSSAASIEGKAGQQLVATLQAVGRQTDWDQSVVRYILSELEGASDYERVLAAAGLVASNNRTAAQRLGAALVVTTAGFVVCGVDAIKHLMDSPQLSAQECLELCSLLVAHLPPIVGSEGTHTNDVSVIWVQNLSLQLQATSTMATATSATLGEQDRAGVVMQLDTLLEMAAQSRKADIPRLEYLHFLVTDHPGKDVPWDQVRKILEELTDSNAKRGISRQVKNEILNALLHSFRGKESNPRVSTYAQLNANRDPDSPLPPDAEEGFDVSTRILTNTPLVLIQNSHEAIEALSSTPFWIAYGNVRTGSTMTFNLMRILANSLADGVISSWVGDFVSTQKFFETIEQNKSIKSGVLKIHHNDEDVNQRLRSGQAKAVISHRNMRECCYSYWRMVNNRNSPFFVENPSLSLLERFIDGEIQAFQTKAKQPHTLLIRESLIREDTESSIKEISEFLGLSVHPEFRLFLADYLSPHNMAKLANALTYSNNSNGHESTTFLHREHVSTEGSSNSCSQEVRKEVDRLLRQEFQASLDESYNILQ